MVTHTRRCKYKGCGTIISQDHLKANTRAKYCYAHLEKSEEEREAKRLIRTAPYTRISKWVYDKRILLHLCELFELYKIKKKIGHSWTAGKRKNVTMFAFFAKHIEIPT
jgi:hypothetical protein